MGIRHVLIALIALCLAACSDSETNYAAGDPLPEHQALQLESKILNETREIAVWLPPGYASSGELYPVVYMPDGGVQEDFPHVANTLAELIAAGDISPVILVGAANTERGRDMTPDSQTADDEQYAPMTDGGANFRAFWRDELIPTIEAKYRTNGERAIVGESLAGLFIVDSFLREPKVFQRHIAMDPSLWWNNHALVQMSERRLQAMNAEDASLWFASSDAEDIKLHTDALAKVLEISAPEALRWTYVPEPQEQHSTIYRATKEAAFRWALWPVEDVAPTE
ncbi:alpha/beta hydrolase-fold protein [Altererythrobacter sp. ZODW24]|uniref:alpha/beta hydrolase n=1 Tax=Altererythrobacter sp. ZODW24 TaxID=2185142 RepID=UPI000DF738E4|nr:alpha/beta hydrolase-fold protein [Altererythrobacter sp. ZODW24]